jgi:hypothetical protein
MSVCSPMPAARAIRDFACTPNVRVRESRLYDPDCVFSNGKSIGNLDPL